MTTQSTKDYYAEHQARAEANNGVLESHGYAPAFSTEGLFGLGGVEFTYCRTCGAGIPLVPIKEDEVHPLDLHRRACARADIATETAPAGTKEKS